MIHWKTNEQMGNGFQHTKKQHKEFEYNSLIKVEPHEKNLMRTYYLIRDIWNKKQILELKEYINQHLKESKE
tara:strand:+ start:867 stop:1082 length:216 start_codon:yes stop_codon:yes gene_type:complete